MGVTPVLVTGGAGFIGSNFVHSLVSAGQQVVTLDALTYAGNRANLSELDNNPNHIFVEGSIVDRTLIDELLLKFRPHAIVNFAAESHVDRSIDGPSDFIQCNIVGVFVLLEAALAYFKGEAAPPDFRFLHVSTDEVYGSIVDGAFVEMSPYDPSSPYAASKAAGDHLVRAWGATYDLPVLITNCSNNYGPYQFPEKLIPLMITKALREEPLPVYGNGQQERDWIHVEDHCRAIERVLRTSTPGKTYLIGAGRPQKNLDVVHHICAILDNLKPRQAGQPYSDLIEFVQDRPGHDLRYAVDPSKIKNELDWRPEIEFEEGLRRTVIWYLEHLEWIESAGSEYRGERLGRTH